MSQRDDAWQRVAGRFQSLGQRFREHFDEAGPGESTEADKEVGRALQDLGDALDRVFTSTGNALRDETVREEGRLAATALGDALGVTLSELGEDLRRIIGRRNDDGAMPPDGEE